MCMLMYTIFTNDLSIATSRQVKCAHVCAWLRVSNSWKSGKTLNNEVTAIDHCLQEMESESKSIKDPVNIFPLQLLRAKSSLVGLQASDWNGALGSCVLVTLVILFHSHIKYCFINVVQKLKKRSSLEGLTDLHHSLGRGLLERSVMPSLVVGFPLCPWVPTPLWRGLGPGLWPLQSKISLLYRRSRCVTAQ